MVQSAYTTLKSGELTYDADMVVTSQRKTSNENGRHLTSIFSDMVISRRIKL